MVQRFKIEDLVVQDASGVVFRAIDGETNQPVAIRRFFPFGPTGGGLTEGEREGYDASIRQLSEISHPALRAILCGGCDPVDSMPYIVTEWIEGSALQTFLRNRPLSQPEAVTVISQALEVCQILSEVNGVEGVWIETDPHTIVIGEEQTGRPVSFWVSPMKWMGKSDGHLGLEAFITLATTLIGWTGKSTRELSSTGLGGWLKWLHGAARTASLHEAREMLAAAMGVEPPPTPAKPTVRQPMVRQPTRPIPAVKKKKPGFKVPVWVSACTLLLAIAAGGGWMLMHRNELLQAKADESPASKIKIISMDEAKLAVTEPAAPAPPPAVAPAPVSGTPAAAPTPGGSREDKAGRKAAEITVAARKADEKKDARSAGPKPKTETMGGVFKPGDHDQLVSHLDKEVVVEGVVEAIGYSGSGKRMYLLFSKNPGNVDFRGAVPIRDATGDLSEPALSSLFGKKIRLKGKVRIEDVNKLKRPVIIISKRNEIQAAE